MPRFAAPTRSAITSGPPPVTLPVGDNDENEQPPTLGVALMRRFMAAIKPQSHNNRNEATDTSVPTKPKPARQRKQINIPPRSPWGVVIAAIFGVVFGLIFMTAGGVLGLVLGFVLGFALGWFTLERADHLKRFTRARKFLWDNRWVQMIIAVLNSKGGAGKTLLSAWLSCAIAWVIKRPVLALDANVNAGHTAKRMGMRRESTIMLRAFLRRLADLQSLEQLDDVINWHEETGAAVVSCEPKKDKEAKEDFSQEEFEGGVRVLKQSSHVLVLDMGNGVDHPANKGSVNSASVLVFAGLARSDDSLDDVETTIGQYIDEGHGDKVHEGIIVIVGAPPRKRAAFAKRYGFPVERVFVLPYNLYMRHDKPVRLKKVPLRVKVVLLEILVELVKIVQSHETDTAKASSVALTKEINPQEPQMSNTAEELVSTS
jgi:hypothetical protein